jgi:hypothetical protein
MQPKAIKIETMVVAPLQVTLFRIINGKAEQIHKAMKCAHGHTHTLTLFGLEGGAYLI